MFWKILGGIAVGCLVLAVLVGGCSYVAPQGVANWQHVFVQPAAPVDNTAALNAAAAAQKSADAAVAASQAAQKSADAAVAASQAAQPAPTTTSPCIPCAQKSQPGVTTVVSNTNNIIIGAAQTVPLVVKDAPPPAQQQPQQVVPTTVPAPATLACVDANQLRDLMNKYHATDENDVRPVTSWLMTQNPLPVKSGSTITAALDSSVFFTNADVDPKSFTKTSQTGTIVAYFGGGRGTIFGLYDGSWTTPVDGWIVNMCSRINPASKEAGLDWWPKN